MKRNMVYLLDRYEIRVICRIKDKNKGQYHLYHK